MLWGYLNPDSTAPEQLDTKLKPAQMHPMKFPAADYRADTEDPSGHQNHERYK